MAEPVYFEEPPVAKRLFASTTFAWLWLVLRFYLGWEWFVAGWEKTFGGNLTWKFWQWGESQYSLTGTANCGWVRSCVIDGKPVPRGSACRRRDQELPGSPPKRRLLLVCRFPQVDPRR